MADYPFIAVIPITLTANGQNSGEYEVSSGNTFLVKRIMQESTGAFSVIDITDEYGNRYTNASVDKPLDGDYFTDIKTDNNNPAQLTDNLLVKGNGKLQFTLRDDSGNPNTVVIYLVALLSKN